MTERERHRKLRAIKEKEEARKKLCAKYYFDDISIEFSFSTVHSIVFYCFLTLFIHTLAQMRAAQIVIIAPIQLRVKNCQSNKLCQYDGGLNTAIHWN